ncbi:hypothetical protein C8035_v000507 [Colletotrichum spinosum]|uniref:AoPex11B-like protein n=1 Tax=Colletotrichum spinosum TaxID=1347390 RepID=A0A4R8Q6D1_9PEZI|nr:hypothetical protein C8035_v000507 [Colletotrichum spinosum]
MTSFTYDQFVAFGSDSAGLERILRGLQSLTSILISAPSLVALALSTPDPPILLALNPLRNIIGLVRRFLRFFWFLNSFGQSYNLYATLPSATSDRKPHGAGLETWLDIVRFTLLGLYGGLESLTLPDLLFIPPLSAFGTERTRQLNVEAQRFWFLALACGVLGNLVRIIKAFAYAPVPQHGAGYGTGEVPKPAGENGVVNGGGGITPIGTPVGTPNGKKRHLEEKSPRYNGHAEGDEKLDWQAERARLRAIVMKRREHRKRWRRNIAVTVRMLGRRVIADSLDTVIPGVILGWYDFRPGTVGVVMLVTTVLTSRDIWDRCGESVKAKRGLV